MRPLRNALLWASHNTWLAERVPRYRFARAAVRRFMPGEDLDSALLATREIQTDHMGTVLTRLGENVTDAAAASDVAAHYLNGLDRVAREKLDAQISVKLTQLGLDIDPAMAETHVRSIAARAAAVDNVVWVDMESSAYVDRTLTLFRSVLADHRNIGLCLQSYLRRTPEDLDALLPHTAAIRLVKGAYDEPAAIAYPRKRDVDAAFLRLAVRLVRAARNRTDTPVPAIATHDLKLLDQIVGTAGTAGVGRDEYEVHMLYGIRAREQARLSAEGHGVRVLISYGEAWFPWYVRRLAERPANIGFVIRSLAMR
jgi:proline dehydrogenase